MTILPLSPRLERYLKSRQLLKKFAKQKEIFELNPRHPGLNTELLEPKHMRVYSFRIDKKYRAIFVYIGEQLIEILDINPHYE